jgi:malic enzyme
LQHTNETVFYRLVGEHVEQMLPIVYTPRRNDGCRPAVIVQR